MRKFLRGVVNIILDRMSATEALEIAAVVFIKHHHLYAMPFQIETHTYSNVKYEGEGIGDYQIAVDRPGMCVGRGASNRKKEPWE